jgi:hypothetical protein
METAGMTWCERQKMAGTVCVPGDEQQMFPEREGSGMAFRGTPGRVFAAWFR